MHYVRSGACGGLLVCLVLFFTSGAVAQEEKDYVSNSQCKLCHNKKPEGEQWNQWKSSKHSKAYETLLGPEAAAAAQKAGLATPPAESPECLRCHVTAYNVEAKAAPEKIKMEDGVQCETCHGPASLHVADGKKLITNKDAGIDPKVHINTHPDEAICRTCHNEQSPTWNPERYTLESGEKAGFDFKQASATIAHPNPLKQQQAPAQP